MTLVLIAFDTLASESEVVCASTAGPHSENDNPEAIGRDGFN